MDSYQAYEPKILILASISGGYAGADSVGQLHINYPANTYVLPMVTAAMLPSDFYLKAFRRGFDGILVMFSGTDCPYKGAADHAARMINATYPLLKEHAIDTRRLRLVAICTVCSKPFLKEVNQMNDLLQSIGPVCDELRQPVAA